MPWKEPCVTPWAGRPAPRFAALAALLLLAAAGALDNVLQFRHTLSNGGRWTSPKMGPWRAGGAWMHLSTRPALRGNVLDLQGQHGFHELLWHEPVEPRRAEFDFELRSNRLCFLFNMDAAGFEGVCADAPSGAFYFAADPGGRFLRREPLESVPLLPGWNRFAASATEDGVEVRLNGAPAGTAPAKFRRGLLGFRGSGGEARVDNVRVETPDGRAAVDETFHHWRGLKGKWTALAALLAAAALALAWAWRRTAGRWPLLAAALLAAAQWGFSWANFTRLSGVYPSLEGAGVRPVREGLARKEEAAAEIRARHGASPEPGVTRVLFLGTSQTRGPGVPPDMTFLRRVERALNGRGTGRYECVNGSLLGGRPEEIVEIYGREWKDLNPRLVVVNLSPRGDDPGPFRGKLAELLELNRALSVRTLLVVEARSAPRPRWSEAVRGLSAEYGVPWVDMPARLAPFEERGFLWYDRTHFTPFAHELAAEALVEPVLSAARQAGPETPDFRR
jgi:hypothetical protein